MATHLPQNQFISNPSVTPEPPTEGPAVASSDLQPRATAELPSESTLGPATGVDTAAGPEFADPLVPAAVIFSEPTLSTGGRQETPASAPTKNPDVGVLAKCNCEYAHCEDFDRPDCKAKAAGLDPWPDGATDHIHEIFAGARKLYPPIDFEEDEVPLFIRDGEHLRRWEA